MIKEGDKVKIIGVGRHAWFYNTRKDFYGITGIVTIIADRLSGGRFNCTITLDQPLSSGIKELGCSGVKLKEVK